MGERRLVVVHVVLKADHHRLWVGGDHPQPSAEGTAAMAIADQRGLSFILGHWPMLAHRPRTTRFIIGASTVS